MRATALEGPWTTHTVAMKGRGEDCFMWVDTRRHWHAVFHAGSGQQLTQCSTSLVAAHTFSADGGKTWNSSATA